MNRKAVFVALLVSLVFSAFLWSRLNKKKDSGEITAPAPIGPPKIPTKSVVCVAKMVPSRTKMDVEIIGKSLEMRDIVASAVPSDAFASVASLTDRFTLVTLLEDDIITERMLLRKGSIPNLARAVPPGKRAVSIAVSKVSSVGGFIRQGDVVDVVATFKPDRGNTITKIVLQDIKVLAVGNTYEFSEITASASATLAAGKVDLVTLAVTPEELEKLMFLDSGMVFRLVLKNPEDQNHRVVTTGATERQIMDDIQPQAASAIPATIVEKPVDVPQPQPQPVAVEEVSATVQVQYGAIRRGQTVEISKYGGPTARKFRKLVVPTPAAAAPRAPSMFAPYGTPTGANSNYGEE